MAFKNTGTADATKVELTDTLPPSVTFIPTGSSNTCSANGNGTIVTCTLGSLATNASTTVTLVVQPQAEAVGSITNKAEVSSTETDKNLKDNTSSETTTVNQLLCNGLVPTIVGKPGNADTLTGTNGRDVIHGLSGKDTITGGNGDDVICGGEGDDALNGSNGNDQVFGENGNDILNGDRGDDALDGGDSSDTCNGGPGRDTATACEMTLAVP